MNFILYYHSYYDSFDYLIHILFVRYLCFISYFTIRWRREFLLCIMHFIHNYFSQSYHVMILYDVRFNSFPNISPLIEHVDSVSKSTSDPVLKIMATITTGPGNAKWDLWNYSPLPCVQISFNNSVFFTILNTFNLYQDRLLLHAQYRVRLETSVPFRYWYLNLRMLTL